MRFRAKVAEAAGAAVVFHPCDGRFHRPSIRVVRAANDNRLPLRIALLRALAIGIIGVLIAYAIL
jgi:hypothetical protein